MSYCSYDRESDDSRAESLKKTEQWNVQEFTINCSGEYLSGLKRRGLSKL